MAGGSAGGSAPAHPRWFKVGLRTCAFLGVVLGLVAGHGDVGRTILFAVLFQVGGNALFVAVVRAARGGSRRGP